MWTKQPILTVREFVEINLLELEIQEPPTVETDAKGDVKGRGPVIKVATLRSVECLFDQPTPIGLGTSAYGALRSLAKQLSGKYICHRPTARLIEVPHLL